jgi:hypothetical protein
MQVPGGGYLQIILSSEFFNPQQRVRHALRIVLILYYVHIIYTHTTHETAYFIYI